MISPSAIIEAVKRELYLLLGNKFVLSLAIAVLAVTWLAYQSLLSPVKVLINGDTKSLVALLSAASNFQVTHNSSNADILLEVKGTTVRLTPISLKGLKSLGELRALTLETQLWRCCSSPPRFIIDLSDVVDTKRAMLISWLFLPIMLPTQLVTVSSFDDFHGGLAVTLYQLRSLSILTVAKLLVSTSLSASLTYLAISILRYSNDAILWNLIAISLILNSLSILIGIYSATRLRAITLSRGLTLTIVIWLIASTYYPLLSKALSLLLDLNPTLIALALATSLLTLLPHKPSLN